MKTKKAFTVEQIEQLIKDGIELLDAKKNEAIEAAEKKYNKKVKALENKYKIVQAKTEKAQSKKDKEAAVDKKKIAKKEIVQLKKEGKSIEEIAQYFETEIETIKAKLGSKGLIDKKGKK